MRDFGPGVSDEQLAHLAEPFYRADSARQRATGGFGLGLYLCRLIAQAHGGTLTFRHAEPGLEVVCELADVLGKAEPPYHAATLRFRYDFALAFLSTE